MDVQAQMSMVKLRLFEGIVKLLTAISIAHSAR